MRKGNESIQNLIRKRSEKRYASALGVESLKSKFERRVDHLNMLIEKDVVTSKEEQPK